MLKLHCLCPTYGRRLSLLENTTACFEAQEYPAAYRSLLLYDDLGTLYGARWTTPGVEIVSRFHRRESIAAKYAEMIPFAGDDWDAAVVWDDDDIYFPWHLSAHAKTLESHKWSKPSRILSTYAMPPGQAREEDARGRFHGSIAIRRELLDRIGGWVQTTRADFDQQMLSRLQREAEPGDTLEHGPPSYVYRWQDSGGGHCSGLMRSPDNQDWYARYQPDSREPITELVPRFDAVTKMLLNRRRENALVE